MKGYFGAFLFILGLSLLFAVESIAACERPAEYLESFVHNDLRLEYWSNFPLGQKNLCIKKVIFVVQGNERNAYARFKSIDKLIKKYDLEREILIISPAFKAIRDDYAPDEYYFSSNGWKEGDVSLNIGNEVSSFELTDRLLSGVLGNQKFPFLQKVMIAGHSAGGQFAQRYALFTLMTDVFQRVRFAFIILNPSSYTYPLSLRPSPLLEETFILPYTYVNNIRMMKPEFLTSGGNCPIEYDDYKYGMQNKNEYASRSPNYLSILKYMNREVFYFVGSLDILTDGSDDLDVRCEAMLQGQNRLERAKNFFNLINRYYFHQHTFGIVDGIGHDNIGMLNSSKVVNALLDVPSLRKRAAKHR